MWMNILCKVFVKVVQLCDTKKVYKKCPRKSQSWRNTTSRVDSCFDIFVCLKSPQIRDLNFMTNSKSEQTLPECCRAHRHWGKPAPEREHALTLRIMTSNKRTNAETQFKFCRKRVTSTNSCFRWICSLSLLQSSKIQVQRGFNVDILTPLTSNYSTG